MVAAADAGVAVAPAVGWEDEEDEEDEADEEEDEATGATACSYGLISAADDAIEVPTGGRCASHNK